MCVHFLEGDYYTIVTSREIFRRPRKSKMFGADGDASAQFLLFAPTLLRNIIEFKERRHDERAIYL